jgi:hypothetical protein
MYSSDTGAVYCAAVKSYLISDMCTWVYKSALWYEHKPLTKIIQEYEDSNHTML